MIHKKARYLLVALVGMFFLIPKDVSAIGNGKEKQRVAKTSATQVATTRMDINNLNALEENNGFSDFNLNSNLEGTTFPKGSGKNVVYEGGFLWGGFYPGDAQVRVGGSAYISGLQPGPILSNGSPAANPNSDPRWSIYRVRPDVYPGGPQVDLSSDVASYAEGGQSLSAAQIRAQYESDWTNWPAAGTPNDLGAPFTDVNGDGKYEPGIDIPGVPGADQTIYYVANDQNASNTVNLYGAQPLGIELHVTFWAYAQQGPLGNMYFKKFDIIHKGTMGGDKPIDSMFVSYWTDVDLGYAGDDLVGCDTTLSMSFTYNGEANDAVYAPLPPPADGFTFFQGPIVPGAATDSAIRIGQPFKFQRVYGKRNLPMTAAYFFINGNANYGDPPQGQLAGSTQFYNFFNGEYGLTGTPFLDNHNNPTKFAFPGDPVAGTGWVDGVQFAPADRRQGMASGPYTMAPGDTQQVVVAEMFGGAIPGVDRLSAISLVKFYDNTAQAAYNNFFQLPVPPPAPKVNAIALNNKVVLDWGEDANSVSKTENYSSLGYTFQGYNVYQLPYQSAGIDQAKRLATYDIVDGTGKIFDQYFDPNQGTVLTHVSEFGNDTGIQRSFFDSTDAFSAGKPLVNGITYFFAVTAYGYNKNGFPHAIENPLAIISITPHSPNPGIRYSYNPGDTIMAVHSGISQGEAFALVVDPTKLTGDQYKVAFDTTGGTTTWNLTDVKTNKVLLTKQSNQSGDGNYSIVDGFMLKVTGPPVAGMNSGDQGTGWDIPKGTRRVTWAGNSLAASYGLEGFSGTIGWASPDYLYVTGNESVPASALCNTLITYAQVTDTSLFDPAFPPASDVNLSFGYRYLRHAGSPAAEPRFAPHIINTTGGTYPFQDFAQTVPLSAWNVDDPAHPKRLVVGYLENNVAGALVDGKYWPPDYLQVDQATAREFLWIYQSPYSTTANPNFEVDALGANPLPVMWFIMWERRGPVPFSPGGTGTDEFIIYANHINTINDSFTFTAKAPTSSSALAKQDVNAVNVFPNPYYGVNSQELNKYARFVTFSHLPASSATTIRIFNLAGVMVRTINHPAGDQFQTWDLTNDSGLPVASGLYIAYVDMPGLGTTKILKLAIIQEQQFPDHF